MRFRGILIASFVTATLLMSCAAYALTENFESYSTGLIPPHWSVYQGSWEILEDFEGNRALYYNDATLWGAIRYDLGNGWNDYPVEVKSNLEYALSGNYFGIGGRVNAAGAGYWLRRSLGSGGIVDLWRGTSYNASFVNWLGSASLPADGKSHTIALDFEGCVIRVYVDGVKKIQKTDTAYAGGSIAFKSGTGCFTWFDNVQAGPAPVPEPSSLIALGSGLLGLVGALRRKIVKG